MRPFDQEFPSTFPVLQKSAILPPIMMGVLMESFRWIQCESYEPSCAMVPRDSHFSADPDLPACQQPSLHPHPVDQYGYPPGFSWHYPGQTEPSYIYHTHPPAQLLVTAPSSGWSHDPPQSIPQASMTNLCPGSGLIDRDIHPNYPIQSAPVYQTHPRAGLVEESQSDIASSEPVVPLSGFQLKVDEFTHSHTEVFEQLNKILGKGQNTKKSERHEMDCIVNCHCKWKECACSHFIVCIQINMPIPLHSSTTWRLMPT